MVILPRGFGPEASFPNAHLLRICKSMHQHKCYFAPSRNLRQSTSCFLFSEKIRPLWLCSSRGLLPNQHSNSHSLRNARNLLLSIPADKSKQHVGKMWPQTDAIQAVFDHRQLKVLMSRCVCGVWAQVLYFSQVVM